MLKITVLQQTHTSPEINNAIGARLKYGVPMPADLVSTYESVAASQYQTAVYLSKHPNIPVIQENSDGFGKNPQIHHQMKLTFPNGLPNQWSELSSLQKDYLVHFSAVDVVVHLGLTPNTHSDNTYYDKNRDQFANKFGTDKIDYGNHATISKINQGREYLTIENCFCVAEKANSNEVIVVYGFLHPFKDVGECFNNIEFNFKNFTANDKLEPTRVKNLSDYTEKYLSHRQKADCQMISTAFNTEPKATGRCLLPYAHTNDRLSMPMDNLAVAGGTVALLGVLAFGLFNCCKKSRDKEKAQTVVHAESMNQDHQQQKKGKTKVKRR